MPSFIVLIPLGFIWVGWLVCYYIFIFLLYFYMYACIVKIYICFSHVVTMLNMTVILVF